MKHNFLVIQFLGLLILAGCEEYEYTIEMRFEDGRVVRKVICSENMPEEVRAKLKGIYEKQIDKNTFEGSFTSQLPQDVGGCGDCVYLNNPMGEIYVYHERFRGKDAQAKDMQHAFASVDKLLDLVIEWLEMELGNHPNFGKLRSFCNQHLRPDLKDICVYTWVDSRVSDPNNNNNETPFRVLQYLYERDYFTLDDVGRLVSSAGDEQAWLAFVRRLIAKQMGYENEDALAEELSFLADEESIEKSVRHFIRNSDTIRQVLEEIPESQKKGNTAADPNEIIELVMKQYEIEPETFFIGVLSSYDQFNVALNLPHEPYATNGQWNKEKGQLTWSRKVRRDEQVEIPFLCYAVFAQANEGYQKKHFGKTILKNEELTVYCLWYKDLTARQQREWDKCLSTLQGQSDMAEKLKAFRFSDMPEWKTGRNGKPIYKTVFALELIQEGLENQKSK